MPQTSATTSKRRLAIISDEESSQRSKTRRRSTTRSQSDTSQNLSSQPNLSSQTEDTPLQLQRRSSQRRSSQCRRSQLNSAQVDQSLPTITTTAKEQPMIINIENKQAVSRKAPTTATAMLKLGKGKQRITKPEQATFAQDIDGKNKNYHVSIHDILGNDTNSLSKAGLSSVSNEIQQTSTRTVGTSSKLKQQQQQQQYPSHSRRQVNVLNNNTMSTTTTTTTSASTSSMNDKSDGNNITTTSHRTKGSIYQNVPTVKPLLVHPDIPEIRIRSTDTQEILDLKGMLISSLNQEVDLINETHIRTMSGLNDMYLLIKTFSLQVEEHEKQLHSTTFTSNPQYYHTQLKSLLNSLKGSFHTLLGHQRELLHSILHRTKTTQQESVIYMTKIQKGGEGGGK